MYGLRRCIASVFLMSASKIWFFDNFCKKRKSCELIFTLFHPQPPPKGESRLIHRVLSPPLEGVGGGTYKERIFNFRQNAKNVKEPKI